MAFLDEIRKIGIGYGFACKRYGDLVRLPRLSVHLLGDPAVPVESRDQASLHLYEMVEHVLRFRPVLELEIVVLDPPAELAHMRTFIDRRRHLETPVALDAVEILLVACPPVDHGFLHPVA